VPTTLSDELFNPLDLEDALEAAFDEGGDEAGVALLERALADPRADGDPALAEYLDVLTEAQADLERYDDAIATAYRLIDVEPGERAAELSWIAQLHARNGDAESATAILYELRAEHQARAPVSRDYLHALELAMTMADHVGDQFTAVEWLADDLRTGMAARVDFSLIAALDGHRRRIEQEAALVDKALDAETARYIEAGRRTVVPQAKVNPAATAGGLPYLPEAEFAQARERGLVGGEHADHRREIELALQALPSGKIRVWPVEVREVVAFAEATGLDPASPGTWRDLIEDPDEGGIVWPPNRNDDCWCGSGRKYKKCCAAPAFLAQLP
jgi:tetratricopeptide (TPR) repeat protein